MASGSRLGRRSMVRVKTTRRPELSAVPAERNALLGDVVATDLFDYLGWQQRPASTAGQAVVRFGAARGTILATMNRRIAAVRGLFESR